MTGITDKLHRVWVQAAQQFHYIRENLLQHKIMLSLGLCPNQGEDSARMFWAFFTKY